MSCNITAFKSITTSELSANYSLEVVQSLPKNLEPGVYYGWAQVDNGPVLKMVANVGWCPFYANKQMSVVSETSLGFFVL